jgi:hypothetical protein
MHRRWRPYRQCGPPGDLSQSGRTRVEQICSIDQEKGSSRRRMSAIVAARQPRDVGKLVERQHA